MTRRIWISAGEPSGDLHAAALVRELRRTEPDVVVDGMGGPQLVAAGARIVVPSDAHSARGLVETVRHLPAHVLAFHRSRAALQRGGYDLAIFVDYPGFHLRVAAVARAAGVPVLYYVAPQLWAWGAGRAERLRRRIGHLAVILPFEEAFFRRLHIRATFVGHPLLDRPRPTRFAARQRLGLDPDTPVVALLPGSRAQDVARHWPLFRDTAVRLTRGVPDLEVLVAGCGTQEYGGGSAWTICRDQPAMVLAAADAAICKSGTATLEATLADTPLVIAYRHHPVTHAVAQRAVRVPWVGLVNLVAGAEVVPELLQRAATPARLAAALLPLLDPTGAPARRQRAGFRRVRGALGKPGAARRVADLARDLVA